jgi:hypothetical protein
LFICLFICHSPFWLFSSFLTSFSPILRFSSFCHPVFTRIPFLISVGHTFSLFSCALLQSRASGFPQLLNTSQNSRLIEWNNHLEVTSLSLPDCQSHLAFVCQSNRFGMKRQMAKTTSQTWRQWLAFPHRSADLFLL